MASAPFTSERFDMGRVVSRAFGAIGRNAPLFFGLAAILTLLPQLIVRVAMGNPLQANDIARVGFASYIVPILGTTLFSFFLTFVLQASISYATIVDLNGERPSFGPTLSTGLRRALPLLLLAIVSALGIYAGMIFLIVPGIILAVMWSVATPALVAENHGVIASLGRSRQLTKGHRWAIFGLFLVVAIVSIIPLMILPLLGGALQHPQSYGQNPLGPLQIVSAVLGMAVSMLFATLVAAVYVELRTIKEGATSDSLAEIFA